MHATYAFRIIGLLLLLNLSTALHGRHRADQLPLYGGCITSPTQYLLFGTVAQPINATPATGGLYAGSYSYQWQRSTDNINFTDIPGATSQNLSFGAALPQTTWFQRKVTRGAEVAYTGTVRVVMTGTLFYNELRSGTFTKQGCTNGAAGTTVTYTVPANTYVSDNQADANQRAQNDVNANGQNHANTVGQCLWYNVIKNGTFTRNNCSSGGIGSDVTYTVPAATYSSNISQADADQKALNDIAANGQNNANAVGSCTWYNTVQSGNFTRNNCTSGTVPTTVTYTVNAGAYSSNTSQADANQKAVNDVNANGQNHANTVGQCLNLFIVQRSGGNTPPVFGVTVKNTSGTSLYGTTIDDFELPFSAAVTPIQSSYIVEMAAMSPMYAIVNGIQKQVHANTSWNVTGPVINIEASTTQLYYNTTQSGNFVRNNCGAGFVGGPYTYSVGAGLYTSNSSQEHANQLAMAAVSANGQAQANIHGSCTQVQNVTITLQNNFFGSAPSPGTVIDFIQNGVVRQTNVFPTTGNGTLNITLPAGSYNMRFTVPQSWAGAPMSFIKIPPNTTWNKPMGGTVTVVNTEVVTFTFGTAYTVRQSGGID